MWKSSRKRQLEHRLGLRTPVGIDATAGQINKLRLQIQGEIIASTDAGYDQARQLSNHAFSEWPLLVAYCEVPSDVAACLAWAKNLGIWFVVRSGGHSTAGFSANSGLVIDMSRFRYAVVEDPFAEHPTAVVGAGTNFGHLNAVLDDYGLHVPGGGCPDVCVAGYMQGGGFGFTSRMYGMNSDNVVAVRVMLADGTIVIADRETNADLFWAIRGGTGNNFGVLLEIHYRLHRVTRLWGFGLKWPVEHAAAALELMQDRFMRGAPETFGYMTFLAVDTPDPDEVGTPLLLMRGMFDGRKKAGLALLQPLLDTEGAELDIDKYGTYEALNEFLMVTPREIPEVPDLGREDKQSGYIDRPLTLEKWEELVDHFLDSPNPWSTIVLEPYGGAISAVPVQDSAFIHRDVDMDLFVDVFWMNDEEEVDARAYLEAFMTFLTPLTNGHSYQNYPRRGTTDYRRRFWGSSFDTLAEIKAKYDPDGAFHFAQSISPPEEPDPDLGGGVDLAELIARPIEAVARTP